MRIKEVEESIGITSKNIRFYEKEGLITPERNSENGYREYSEKDIKNLKEIKLFRQLGISIEDIRLLQSREIGLGDVLKIQMDKFKNQIESISLAKDLCMQMAERNVSFKEIEADLWLDKIKELEGKGARFMNIDNDDIIRFLPDKFRMQYYESIIKNGQIDNNLFEEIMDYFEDVYKKAVDTEELLMDTLKKIDSDERAKLLLLVKENNLELYNKISKYIFDFEDIVTLDKDIAKNILKQFEMQNIIKASKAASPKVNEYLQSLFPNIDFVKEQRAVGMIPMIEIVNIHEDIVKAINCKTVD